MATRMLIDARHREETRVAVVKNNRIEEFDFESEEHKQLKGNIYLAKVTRVEPSLQAAFVDYGGNRHGFLAFSEIHPDYYQIPKEDREKLLAEEVEQAKEEAQLRESEDDAHIKSDAGESGEEGEETEVEETGDADADEEPQDEPSVQNIRKRRMDLRRRYKIQDVIRRRQVLLVQVVKEERGNKGAALTSYLSLAGRYCVLMPNTSHGGGISRKISNASDRKRLKSVISDLSLPDTMGCIVRTAGMTRTKTEIKRDFTYLARLWGEIREATLGATAPSKIYTDSDLIKRAIRDIYNREIDEVLVEGEEGYKAAKNFMKLLMPSHARKVKQYAEVTPLFQRYQVEDQLGAMYQPVVQLKSGGYLVINPTEALVSIDINSGRSTREHNIEQTALKTNIEAAREIARQLRLRDMAGLVVIDFIDMDHRSNNRKVESALKDALKNDRARIQVGRISSFGLLEMSRQRLRTGMLEASTHECPHCEGTGLMRTASSAGLSALRMLEEEAARGKGSKLVLTCSRDAAVYVLNSKRRELGEIEELYGVSIEVHPDRTLEGAAMEVSASGPAPTKKVEIVPLALDDDDDDEIEEEDEEQSDEDRPRSRRRRGRRGGRGRRSKPQSGDSESGNSEGEEKSEGEQRRTADSDEDGDGAPRKKSRRGRRGGRRRKPASEGQDGELANENGDDKGDEKTEDAPAADPVAADTAAEESEPAKPKRRRTRKKAEPEAEPASEATKADEASAEPAAEEKPEKPKRAPRRRTAKAAAEKTEAAPVAEAAAETETPAESAPAKPRRSRKKAETTAAGDTPAATEEPTSEAGQSGGGNEPVRRGWWQRTFGE
ncbi:Rne/Rng family ribonuclease [Parasphingopyxis lamellibrachiae]|uniref:Ribonuclease E n=1 Tax=Parasphingopyxis lamellibrachiae TaxID=680125 RepID=A0A3D9FEG3_9SPHN|nr:ribonuclease E/G [Parasphingopyxis lamellibrachiae]RED16224.1 RNAse E [Parasphingopyxis lamellibrachiae]